MTALTAETRAPSPPRPPAPAGPWPCAVTSCCCIVLLYLPIAILFVFSFNDSSVVTFPLKGFTLEWYQKVFANVPLLRSIWASVHVAVGSGLVATVLGYDAGDTPDPVRVPLQAGAGRARTLPLIVPYVVLGVALLILFRAVNVPLSLLDCECGTRRRRPAIYDADRRRAPGGLRNALEEAAMDLGATYPATLRLVVLPIIAPSIIAAGSSRSPSRSTSSRSLCSSLARTRPSRLPLRPAALRRHAARADRRRGDADGADARNCDGQRRATESTVTRLTASQAAGLTLSVASAIVAGAEGHAQRLGIAISCAVVDSGDQLVAFERMDGADLVTISLAKDKAFTALVNHMPTSELAPMVQPGTEFYGYDSLAGGRMIVFGGGLPIEMAGVLVGAVGVSGGSAEQDEACAAAGLESAGGG